MLPTFKKSFSSPVEQEILSEEKKYKIAFEADAEFHVLKDIRQTIKRLKHELSKQRMHGKDEDN